MKKALAIKELRDTWWIAALGLVLYLAVVSALMGVTLIRWIAASSSYGRPIPFVNSSFVDQWSFYSCVLAIAIAMRQSAWENMRGTYLFLLHRPASWRAIFTTKMLTGLALVQFTAALPIILASLWAATPGMHASPFEWSMTEPAWWGWLTLPVLYFGAFLTGLRPARWFGTRLLPLIGAFCIVLFLNDLHGWPVAFWSLTACLVLFSAILYVANQRDFG